MPVVDALRPSGMNARALDLLPRVAYRRALDDEERDDIFHLRYDAYLREGAIGERSDRRFSDAVDDQDNTFLFGIHLDDELVSSIRLNVTLPGASALPTMAVFPEFVGPKVDAGEIIVDPTRFVSRPTMAGRLPELPYLTLRLVWLAMEHFDADWMLIAVRPEHRAFYRRFWGADEVCEPRPYPKLAKPVGLSVLDFRAARARVVERYPYLRSTEAERLSIFETSVPTPQEQELPCALWQVEPKQPALGLAL